MSNTSAQQHGAVVPAGFPTDMDKARIGYAMDQYKLYHGHINTMFNYFLILEGLIGNAYVTSLGKDSHLPTVVPTFIASFGLIATLILWLVHRRSRGLLDILEKRLKLEEDMMFPGEAGFLNVDLPHLRFYARHRYQFQIIFGLFAVVFLAAGLYPNLPHFGKVYAHYTRHP